MIDAYNPANEVYLIHYILQSCGWVKIHEYTCNSLERAAAVEADIRARYPNDTARFEIRNPRNVA